MSETAALSRQRVIRRLQTAGFRILRDGSDTVMGFGERSVTVPPEDPVSQAALDSILRDAGIDMARFEDLGSH